MTDSAWPTFIAPPLSSPSTVNNCWAALSISSALTSSLDLPVSRLPTPNAARPAMPAPRPASFALRAARPRLMSLTRPSSMTPPNRPATTWQRALSAGAVRVARPAARHDRTRVDVELQRGVQRRRRFRQTATSCAAADRADDAVDLVERQRRGRQHGGPVGAADGVAQLRRDRRPRARRGRCGAGRRTPGSSSRPGMTSGPTRPVPSRTRTGRCGHPGGVQVAHHPRIGHQVVRQHHQVGRLGRRAGMRAAAVRDPRTRAAQRAGEQIRQRPAAVDADGRGAGTPARDCWSRHRRRPTTRSSSVGVDSRTSTAARQSVAPDCMDRSSSASATVLTPVGGRTNTARRGSQPTCTVAVGAQQHRRRRIEGVPPHTTTLPRPRDGNRQQLWVIHRPRYAATASITLWGEPVVRTSGPSQSGAIQELVEFR